MSTRTTRQEKAQQVQQVLANLFSGQPEINRAVTNDIDMTTVAKLMRMDRNRINTYIDEDGNALLTPEQQDMLSDGVDYINHLQNEKGLLSAGIFDINGISEESLEEWLDEGWPAIKYSAPEARKRAMERKEADAMVEKQRLEREILEKQLENARNSGASSAAGGGATASSGANTGTGQGSGQSGGQPGRQSGTYNDSKTSTKVDLSEEMSVFLHGSQYNKWIKVVNMLAKATGTSKTLDPNYMPSSQRETDNWNQQQALMFVALNKNVKLPIGLTILEKHLDKSDAQAVFRELADHFAGPGAIEITETEDKLHDKVFMTDAKWYLKDKPGSTLTDAIERWERYLLQHDSTTGTVTSPTMKKKAFQKFIKPIKELSHVTDNEKSTTALMGITAASTLYTPDMVIQLYKNAATRIDLERKESVLKNRGTISRAAHLFNQLYDQRSANVTICSDISNNSLDDDTWYTVFLANTGPALRLSPEIWGAMTKEERTMWLRGLRREIRDMILSARANQGATLSGPPSASAPRDRPRDFSSAPKSRTNPTSRYRSGRDPRREGPVNHKARANVTETNRAEYDDDEVVERNVHEMTRALNINSTEGLYDEDGPMLGMLRRSVHQSSHRPPFDPMRFLSETESSADHDTSGHEASKENAAEENGESQSGQRAVEANVADLEQPDDERSTSDGSFYSATDEIYEDNDQDDDSNDYVYAARFHELDLGGDGDFSTYRFASVHESLYVHSECGSEGRRYNVSRANRLSSNGLMDRGANGGVSGDPRFLRTISKNDGQFIDIVGIDNHTLNHIPIGTVGGVAKVVGPDGKPMEVILIMHQYAIFGQGKSIHAPIQFEAFSHAVDDKAIRFGGTQTVRTPEGYLIPLDMQNGLIHLSTRAYTDEEFARLPHIVMTSSDTWNPNVGNNHISEDPTWFAAQESLMLSNTENFNAFGQYLHRNTDVFVSESTRNDDASDFIIPPFVTLPPSDNENDPPTYTLPRPLRNTALMDSGANQGFVPADVLSRVNSGEQAIQLLDIAGEVVEYTALNDPRGVDDLFEVTHGIGELLINSSVFIHEQREVPTNFESYRPFFLHAPREVVMHTFDATTRYYQSVPNQNRITDTIRSHFPAANAPRRHELVAGDTVFFDLEAWGGAKCCQFFIGRRSYFMSVWPMKTDGDFVNALEDEIRFRGAMDVLFTDNAQAEISNRVKDLLRNYRIRDHQSEAYYQQQNFAERYIQELKKLANRIRNKSGCPPEMIMHVLEYVVFIWNRTARRILRWRTPIEALTGQTPDISMLLHFRFWQRVYISNYQQRDGTGFPSESNEIEVRFIGFAETTGHAMTFKVYNPDTGAVLYRSRLRAATEDDANHPGNDPNDDDRDGDATGIDAENGSTEEEHGEQPDGEVWHDELNGQPTNDGGTQGASDQATAGNASGTVESGADRTQAESRGASDASSRNQAQPRGAVGASSAGNEGVASRTRSRQDTMDNPQVRSPTGTRVRFETPPSSETPRHHRATSGNPNQSEPPPQPTASTDPTIQNPLPPASEAVLDEDFLHSCIGRHVLLNAQEDGQRFRAKIVGLIEEFEGQRDQDPERIKFKCEVGEKTFSEVVDYNEMCSFIEEQRALEDGTWRMRRITGHSKPKYKSQKPKVLIEWESGEITLEPTYTIGTYDVWMVAEYAKDKGLLDEWHAYWPSLKLKKYARNSKKLMRLQYAAKRLSYKNAPIWQYGYQVPHDHIEAVKIDEANGNTKWQDAEKLEKDQMMALNTFIDKGHKSTARRPGPEYTRIDLHTVYAVKHDGRHKSRIVAGGHMTATPLESVYSGVVSLRGVRFVVFLAELNGLELYQTDISNAYLESYTQEKVYVIGGPELHELEDHVLIIHKALYGLKSSGLRWHERFADVLRDMGFTASTAEPDIWFRAMDKDGNVIKDLDKNLSRMKATTTEKPTPSNDGSYYEYIAVYTDDLTIASKDPLGIVKALTENYKFKFKGTAPLNFLLGCDYYRDRHGVLCAEPKKYLDKMEETYFRLFGTKPPQKVHSPLEANDNPELDTSELLDDEWTRKYQSLIGSAQWIVSLGRFDIAVHVGTLSSFRAMPRQGHLDRIKRVYAYLCKFRHGTIRYRTEMPDVSDYEFPKKDWHDTPFYDSKEEFPTNLPTPRGKPVLMTTYVDANLGHDKISGKSCTGVLHFLNKTPIDWFSKKQGTVESATFGSENVAARTALEQIKANKLALMHLGVPIHDTPILLGDNKSVVDSNTQPKGKLHKRHLMLSYNFVREAVASGALRFSHIAGDINLSDVLSKHWSHGKVWHLLKPVLFWMGDTMKIEERKSGDTD
jgi:hypothetical protein